MNTPNANVPTRRPTKESRKPFGSQIQKLAYPQRVGFHRHWFNDEPGRIEEALQAGYTHVEDKDGRKVQRVVGVATQGGALMGFLMEIPEEWFKEDMARNQQVVDERDAAIKAGHVTEEKGANQYVPQDRGISIKHGR